MAEDVSPPEGFTLDPAPPEGFQLVAPEPAKATVTAPPGWTLTPEKYEPSVMDRFLEGTSIGRIVGAMGHGMAAGWGVGRLGMSDETAQALRDAGVFPGLEAGWRDAGRTFVEATLRPAAAGLDALARGTSAIITGVAGAGGQAAQEVGMEPAEANRLVRDLRMLGETALTVAGTEPAPPRIPRNAAGTVATKAEAPIAEAGTLAQRPFAEAPKAEVPVAGPSAAEAAVRAPEAQAAEPVPAYAAAETKPPTKTEPETPTQLLDKADDGPVDRAGNINLNYIDDADKIGEVLTAVAEKNGGFVAERRGVITVEQTQDLARALGMTPEELAKRKIGEAFNAEQIDAARTLLVDSATALREAGVKAGSGLEADLVAYAEAEARHTAIQAQVSGLTAEAGRALNIFKVMKQSTEKAQAIKAIMDQYGGQENAALRAKMIADLETPEQVSRFLRDARKATTGDMLREIYVNSVLSGLRTQGTNIISNFTNVFWSPAETLGTAATGKVRQLAGNEGERVMFGEAKARLYGIVQAQKEGIILARKAFREEVSQDGVTNLDVPRPNAVPGKVGSAIRIPGRALVGVDEYFKAIARRQELNALAYRKATKEGLTGEAFSDRVAELVENPTNKMQSKARDFALKQTFQSELGPVGKALQTISNSSLPGKMIVTFVRAPINILKFANEMTPLGLLAKEVRANLKGENGKVAQDTQIAKLAAGSAILVTAYSLAAEGKLSGAGPKDPAERAMWFLAGNQPYSVKIGDYWYSHRALGPFSVLLGATADLHEIRDRWDDLDADKVTAMMLGSVTNNIVNQSWARGAAGFLQAVEDPTRYGERYLQQLSSPLVPNFVAQLAQAQDPYFRDVRSVLDGLKVRAGFPDGVPVRRDIWGEPIERGGSLGPDFISPIYERRVSNDPVNQELMALHFFPSKLDRHIRGVELTDQQYDDLQRIGGRFAKYQLDRMVGMQAWQNLPAPARVEAVKKTVDRARAFARSQIMLENPQILRQVVDKRLKNLGLSASKE